MDFFSSSLEITTRYAETDQMGFVHHGNYTHYFELGRIDWLKKLGFSYKKMEEEGVWLPVVHLDIHYKKSLSFDQTFVLKTSLHDWPSYTIVFDYQIEDLSGSVLVVAQTKLVFLDAHSKKPTRCPADLMTAIKKH